MMKFIHRDGKSADGYAYVNAGIVKLSEASIFARGQRQAAVAFAGKE